MKDLWPELLLSILWSASCSSPPPLPSPYPVHSIKTITTICPGSLCGICAANPESSK